MEEQVDPRELAMLAALQEASRPRGIKERIKGYFSMEYYKHWLAFSLLLLIIAFHLWPK